MRLWKPSEDFLRWDGSGCSRVLCRGQALPWASLGRSWPLEEQGARPAGGGDPSPPSFLKDIGRAFPETWLKKKKSRGLGSPEMLTDTEYTSTEATAPWLQ